LKKLPPNTDIPIAKPQKSNNVAIKMVLALTFSSPLSRLGNIISFMVKALHLGLLVFSFHGRLWNDRGIW